MEPKFTPGPWELDKMNTYIFGPDSTMIAQVRGFGASLPMHANGLLLAAAPDLYAALKDALLLLDMFIPSTRGEEQGSIRDRIVSAIEKADGKHEH